MKDFISKKSLEDFSDRELLLFLLANQVLLFREMKYLMQEVKGGEHQPLGHFSKSFDEMIKKVDGVLEQSEEYLNREDEEKGFIKF